MSILTQNSKKTSKYQQNVWFLVVLVGKRLQFLICFAHWILVECPVSDIKTALTWGKMVCGVLDQTFEIIPGMIAVYTAHCSKIEQLFNK